MYLYSTDVVGIVAMRWLKYYAYGVVLLLACGAVFQAIASSRLLHRSPGSREIDL